MGPARERMELVKRLSVELVPAGTIDSSVREHCVVAPGGRLTRLRFGQTRSER